MSEKSEPVYISFPTGDSLKKWKRIPRPKREASKHAPTSPNTNQKSIPQESQSFEVDLPPEIRYAKREELTPKQRRQAIVQFLAVAVLKSLFKKPQPK